VRAAIAFIALVAACSDPPPLTIKYALKTDGSQLCYANAATQTLAHSCTDVSMLCKSVLDLRIVSASDTTQQYVKVCQEVTGRQNLCSIAGIDLPKPASSIPEQTLEVQVALFVEDDLAKDPDTGDPICPPDLEFGADGLPVSSSASPAVGGRAFYHPGDTSTVVELGCTDELALQKPSCAGTNTIAVTATVNDFDTEVSVPATLADSLSVLIGEPVADINGFSTLPPTHLHPLDRTVVGPTPGWGGAVDLQLLSSACLEVLEDVPQATPSLVCKQVAVGQEQIDLPGIRLSKTTLQQFLTALNSPFPAEGLVVGVVLDDLGNPAAGVQVTTSDPAATLSYLSQNRQSLIAAGLTTSTTSNGIFLSTDTRYGATFTAIDPLGGTSQPSAFGGLVQGKVSVVVLQFTQPTKP
jgi:hypothetical protein